MFDSLGSFIKPSIFQESAVNTHYFVYNAARLVVMEFIGHVYDELNISIEVVVETS